MTLASAGMDGSLRDRKKANTRRTIIHTALRLFNEVGYDDTTVQMIADLAEVSPATVFRYFESKESIAFSERDRQVGLLHGALLERPLSEPDLVAVRRAYDSVVDAPEYDFDRLRLLRSAAERSSTLRGAGLVSRARYIDDIAKALDERAAAPALAMRHEAVARLFMAAVDLAYTASVDGDGPEEFLGHLDEALVLLRDCAQDIRKARAAARR